MKYLVVGDVHISSENRLEDRKQVLAQIVGLAVIHNANKVLWAGDLFDSRHPNPEECNALYETIMGLKEVSVQSILLIGNHDKSKGYSALDVFEKLKVEGVKVVEENYIENGIFLGHFLLKELVLSNDIELRIDYKNTYANLTYNLVCFALHNIFTTLITMQAKKVP